MGKAVVLFSGGKDSNFAVLKIKEKGYDLDDIVLLSLESKEGRLFHKPNLKWVDLQAEAMGVNIIRKKQGDRTEIEALREELQKSKESGAELVVTGALASNYQRKNFSKVCKELDLNFYNPFWQMDSKKYMESLIKNGFKIIFSSYSAMGFNESWLGRKLNKRALKDLVELNKEYRVHIAGEGGEYETFVLNSPLFKKKIRILESRKIIKGKYRGRLKIEKAELTEKD